MLSDLALAVKGSWGYDQAFIESCRDELTFGPDDIARRHFVAADLGGLVAGCYSVDGDPPVGELGNRCDGTPVAGPFAMRVRFGWCWSRWPRTRPG
jgi:hypothetical protein